MCKSPINNETWQKASIRVKLGKKRVFHARKEEWVGVGSISANVFNKRSTLFVLEGEAGGGGGERQKVPALNLNVNNGLGTKKKSPDEKKQEKKKTKLNIVQGIAK